MTIMSDITPRIYCVITSLLLFSLITDTFIYIGKWGYSVIRYIYCDLQ